MNGRRNIFTGATFKGGREKKGRERRGRGEEERGGRSSFALRRKKKSRRLCSASICRPIKARRSLPSVCASIFLVGGRVSD